MTERLEQMKKKRGMVRASVTKLLSRMENEMAKEEPDFEKLRELLSLLSTKEESLTESSNGFKSKRWNQATLIYAQRCR